MLSNGLFALGFAGPLILFWLGHAVIGITFAVAAILTRRRANPRAKNIGRPDRILWAIAILACAELASILGASFLHVDGQIGAIIVAIGLFVLWPVSAILSLLGRGATGQKVLLLGHGLIAFGTCVLLLAWWLWDHNMIGNAAS
jgi:hypothetical protein